MKVFLARVGCVIFLAAGTAGCTSLSETVRDGWRESPTGSLVRGDIAPGEYLGAVTRANEDARRREQFEFNRDRNRAFNRNTGRIEHVPDDADVFWNEETERWEFTPVAPRDRSRASGS
ncbi:MAG: hypothetical protein JJT96_14910 [Opitutales bacterium]|nr:hypothetical protein [Opitutales bacterium]